MDTARAVDWMLRAASGQTVRIDRQLASDLLNEVENLMDHFHPDPNGADYCCEFCGNSPRSVWDAKEGRYRVVPTVHRFDCLGFRARGALTAALGT